jgi:hypothetical protein
MPLSSGASRKPIHNRNIEWRGYLREAGFSPACKAARP